MMDSSTNVRVTPHFNLSIPYFRSRNSLSRAIPCKSPSLVSIFSSTQPSVIPPPKSINQTLSSSSTSIFSGLKSPHTMPAEWRRFSVQCPSASVEQQDHRVSTLEQILPFLTSLVLLASELEFG